MVQLGKRRKNPNYLGMYHVYIIQFHSECGRDKHRKAWHAICECKICSSVFMKQQSRDCTIFWITGYHYSKLNHLKVKILNIIIMFWMEEFQDMVHSIIIYWFDRSGVYICNRFRVRFKRKLLRVKLNITIINGMVIKSHHDSWNHRNSFGRRGTGFEVRFWRLDVPLSWWLSWFITIKGVELVRISSNNWWEEVRATDNSGISLVSNSSKYFANNLLSNVKICNKWLESLCIFVRGIWGNKIMIALNWSGQCS